jgi:hypothetical protein
MADILDDTIAAEGESAELAVTPGVLLATAPCEVLAKNGADGGESWGVIYRSKSHDDTQWLKPTSDTIKVRAFDEETRVAIWVDES